MEKQVFEFKTIEIEKVWFVGKKTIVSAGKTATKFVKKFRFSCDNIYLQEHPNRLSKYKDIGIWMGDYDATSKSFIEIPGVFMKPNSDIKQGFDIKEIPACVLGIFLITGSNRDITKGAHNKLVKKMTEACYIPDYSYGFSMEYYSYEKFELPTDEFTFVYILPCKRKQ